MFILNIFIYIEPIRPIYLIEKFSIYVLHVLHCKRSFFYYSKRGERNRARGKPSSHVADICADGVEQKLMYLLIFIASYLHLFLRVYTFSGNLTIDPYLTAFLRSSTRFPINKKG